MTGPSTFLLAYGIITTLTTTILAILYSHCGPSETIETVKGDVHSATKTEYGLVNIDSGDENFSDTMTDCDCGLFKLEWTILEMVVMGCLGLATICGMIKGILHLKHLVLTRKEKVQEKKRKQKQALHQKIREEMSAEPAARYLSRLDKIATVDVEPETAQKAEQISYP